MHSKITLPLIISLEKFKPKRSSVVSAGACHRARRRRDPVAGPTVSAIRILLWLRYALPQCLPKVGEATLPIIGLRKRGGALHVLAKMIGVVLALLGAPSALRAQTIPGALPESTAALARGEWPAYAGTYASARYSPLTQIDRDSAKNLHVAWRWKSPDQAIKDADHSVGPTSTNESTPLMVGGTLYTSTSLSEVAAIDAVSGETKWVFDPKVYKTVSVFPPTTDGCIAASRTGAAAMTNAS
jgi:glucose dehydrogenase